MEGREAKKEMDGKDLKFQDSRRTNFSRPRSTRGTWFPEYLKLNHAGKQINRPTAQLIKKGAALSGQ